MTLNAAMPIWKITVREALKTAWRNRKRPGSVWCRYERFRKSGAIYSI